MIINKEKKLLFEISKEFGLEKNTIIDTVSEIGLLRESAIKAIKSQEYEQAADFRDKQNILFHRCKDILVSGTKLFSVKNRKFISSTWLTDPNYRGNQVLEYYNNYNSNKGSKADLDFAEERLFWFNRNMRVSLARVAINDLKLFLPLSIILIDELKFNSLAYRFVDQLQKEIEVNQSEENNYDSRVNFLCRIFEWIFELTFDHFVTKNLIIEE